MYYNPSKRSFKGYNIQKAISCPAHGQFVAGGGFRVCSHVEQGAPAYGRAPEGRTPSGSTIPGAVLCKRCATPPTLAHTRVMCPMCVREMGVFEGYGRDTIWNLDVSRIGNPAQRPPHERTIGGSTAADLIKELVRQRAGQHNRVEAIRQLMLNEGFNPVLVYQYSEQVVDAIMQVCREMCKKALRRSR